ncbi:MAG: hypothetical protein IPK16_00995 [Anaerolineales bacterium]|nr:hypothetical protein [Anaerolineales bacterium]
MKSMLWTDADHPTPNGDGTLTGIIAAPALLDDGGVQIHLALPPQHAPGQLAGRYLLARCGAATAAERAENWQFYLRRPLFFTEAPHARPETAGAQVCRLLVRTAPDDPAVRWLGNLNPGQALNVIGPNGNGFPLPLTTQRLLLLEDDLHALLLLPLVETALDRGCRVSLFLITSKSAESWRRRLPMAVELRPVSPENWHQPASDGIRWADQTCAALPNHLLAELGALVAGMRLGTSAVFVLPDADLACGYGACLACVVPLANGHLTRACIHGPVFDLREMLRL